MTTQQKFEQLEEVEILPHPDYSPGLAPSDYGLFQSMQHFLRGRRFGLFDEVRQVCSEFFSLKPNDWYFQQIHMLSERWMKVVQNEGLSFEE